jgi:hypothetical protein
MITIQKVTSNIQIAPASLQTFLTHQRDTRLTLTPSVIPNYNYVIMVSETVSHIFTFYIHGSVHLGNICTIKGPTRCTYYVFFIPHYI